MLNPDFRDMLCALNAAGVEYLVVGAYAMAQHGYLRGTGDMDCWIRPTSENAERTVTALTAFGAPPALLDQAAFRTEDMIVQIGLPPNRIDLITSIEAVRFEDAWSTRVVTEVDGVPIPFLGFDALLQNKRATGRPKDRNDVEVLERINRRRPRP